MTNLFEGMDEIFPDVLFSELLSENGVETYYSFRLTGWGRARNAGSGLNNYKVVESVALEDYSELGLFKGQFCNLHISMPVFQRYLIKFLSYHRSTHVLDLLKDTSRILVIELRFCRTRKKMSIAYLKIFEVLGKNEEKLIAECPKVLRNE